MFDGLPIGSILTSSSPWVLLALTVLFIMTRKLIPERTYLDMKDDRDAWKEAHRVSEVGRVEALELMRGMAESQEAIANAVRALPPPPADRVPQRRR